MNPPMTTGAVRPFQPHRLPPALSVYLDLVRFVCAVIVVLCHAWPILFPANPFPWPGHDAVVVFFVLSGLVIAHATNRPGMRFSDYAVHRVARIWSVALPALALSLAVSAAVGFDKRLSVFPAASEWPGPARAIAVSLIPIGQIWQLHIDPPLNGPFWSLNFEVWYYALFGAWTFLQGQARFIVTAILAAIAGPKILIMMPIWILGVYLYWRRPIFTERGALALFILTAIAIMTFASFDVSMMIRRHIITVFPGLPNLSGANQFAGDWLFALIIGIHFAAAASLGRFGHPLLGVSRWIRAAASCTFSAYLYHLPLLTFAVLALHLRPLSAMIFVAASIVIMASLTERQAPAVRRILAALLRWPGIVTT